MTKHGLGGIFGRRAIRVGLVAVMGLGLLAMVALRVEPVKSSGVTSTGPGMQPTQAVSPTAAASPTPAAPPTSSPQPSPAVTPSPVPAGGGQWSVNGATVKALGALATEVDTGGNVFTGSAKATKGAWNVRFGVSGQGPVSAQGTANGPSPFVIDLTLTAFGLPITVHGTPGKDLSVGIGTAHSSLLDGMRPVAAVQTRAPLAADSPEQTAARFVTDTLRSAVAFSVVGWLLLLIAPGLRRRGTIATRSVPLSRLGIGAVLALDIPLGALVLTVLGVPIGLWWAGLVVLAMFAALVVAAYAFSGYQLGVLVLDRVTTGRLLWLAEVPLGVLVLVVAGQIPYVGPVVSIIAVVYGIGSMLYAPAAEERAAELEATPALEPRPAAAELPAGGKPQVE